MLIEIAPPDFDVVLDIRYATPDNLTGAPIYRRPRCALRLEAVQSLFRAIDLARGLGYRLRLFDGFRPVEAQWRLWRALPDPMFIADPRIGSHHSRGVAVDLTLDGADGRPLDMGTGFDDMTPASHHGRADPALEIQRNRALLLGVMTAAGWDHNRYEWWHYQLPDAGGYPLLSESAVGGGMLSV